MAGIKKHEALETSNAKRLPKHRQQNRLTLQTCAANRSCTQHDPAAQRLRSEVFMNRSPLGKTWSRSRERADAVSAMRLWQSRADVQETQ